MIELGQVNEEAGGVAWRVVPMTVAKADRIAPFSARRTP
jgi:hypothetical protein